MANPTSPPSFRATNPMRPDGCSPGRAGPRLIAHHRVVAEQVWHRRSSGRAPRGEAAWARRVPLLCSEKVRPAKTTVCQRRRLRGQRQRDERRRPLAPKFSDPVLPPPNRQQRARNPMSSRGRARLAMPGKALLDDPQLVRVAPMSTTRSIRGGQDFNLGFASWVGHKVGPITRAQNPSGGPRRRVTLKGAGAPFDMMRENGLAATPGPPPRSAGVPGVAIRL